jgi:CRP/FNR family cyclic AMP-dependent transcriptional regulator
MLLSSIFLFKDLSESHLKKISNTVKETCAEKGRWLFHEGSSADRIYALRSGAVELLTRINDDIELPVKILRNEGGCFGISALIPPYQYSLSSRCAEDAVLLEIMRRDIEKLTQEDQTLGCTIMTNLAQYLLERLKETRQDLKIHFKTLFRSMQT